MIDIEGDIGGNCPVQGDGTVYGHAWYFRARGQHWSFHISAIGHEADVVDAGEGSPGWCVFEQWGEHEYDAGWMPEDVAWQMIAKSVDLWRSGKAEYFSGNADNVVPIADEEIDRHIATMQSFRLSAALLANSPLLDKVAVRARFEQSRSEFVKRQRERYGNGVPEQGAWSDEMKAMRSAQ